MTGPDKESMSIPRRDMRMAPPGLGQAWRRATRHLPPNWRICGVVVGPRSADPAIEGEHWVAWARGPQEEQPVEGSGELPEQAMLDLAHRLRDRTPRR